MSQIRNKKYITLYYMPQKNNIWRQNKSSQNKVMQQRNENNLIPSFFIMHLFYNSVPYNNINKKTIILLYS